MGRTSDGRRGGGGARSTINARDRYTSQEAMVFCVENPNEEHFRRLVPVQQKDPNPIEKANQVRFLEM